VVWHCNGGGAMLGVIRKKPKPASVVPRRARHSGDAVTAPMQGTVVKVAVEEGQQVATGDLVVVLEAMKNGEPGHRTRTAPSPDSRSRPAPHHPGHGARRDQVAPVGVLRVSWEPLSPAVPR